MTGQIIQLDPMGFLIALIAMLLIGLVGGFVIGRITAGDDDDE